jgi:hypothetical protein
VDANSQKKTAKTPCKMSATHPPTRAALTQSIPTTALELRSLVQADGTLQISLESIPVPAPGPDEVLIQMQATPINPSDIGLLAPMEY